MSIHIDVNGKKKVKDSFISVDGAKKKVKSIWVNKDGVVSKIYSGGAPVSSGIFVIVKYDGTSISSMDNGLTWNPMTGIPTGVNILSVTYGNGKFVCVGFAGQAYYSLDGLTWNPMTGIPTTVGATGSHMNSVTYGNGKFVCVGKFGKSYYSLDGLTWNPMVNIPQNVDGICVSYGNNKFLCGIRNMSYIYSSTNLLKWENFSSGVSGETSKIVYGNNRFFSRGQYSLDGNFWTNIGGDHGGSTNLLNDVTYGNGKFVCVGSKMPCYSINGTTWNPSSSTYPMTLVIHGKDIFLGIYYNGKIYSSIDGITWNYINEIGQYDYRDIAYSSDGGYEH